MSVSIIIPNWNGAEKLKKNLPEVLKVQGVDEVIVVDDASTDDSVEIVKRLFPKVKLIEKNQNTGFGSNVNQGVAQAFGDYIFLVNSDAIPAVDCVKKALEYFQDPTIFGVGFNTGGNWSWAKFEDGFLKHYKSAAKVSTHETLWVSGGSAIIRKDLWDILGGFDPLYDPFYVEDVDLGYRAWKRGYKNIWISDVYVEHYKEVGVIARNFSSKKITDTSERNMLIFIWKNILDRDLIYQHIKELIKRLILHPKYWPIFLSAMVRLPQILERRKIEAREMKLSDKDILSYF